MNHMLFDPVSYERVRRPAMEAESLPPGCYTDPDFFAAERERVFRKGWVFIGHADQIASPGDFMTDEVGGAPLIVLRGRDGSIRAFANSCRHRGCRVVTGEGNARALQCRYHGWTYGLDGSLKGAPQMEYTTGFDKADYGLHPVRLETWGRLLFITLDPETPALDAWMGSLWDMLAPYNFGDMVLARRRSIDLACNWKVYIENLMEPYHTPTIHAGGMADKNEDPAAAAMSGNATSEFGGGGPEAPVQLDYGANFGVLVARHTGSRGLLPGREPFPAISGLDARTRDGSIWSWIYPSLAMSCQREAMWYNRLIPTGPETCTLVIGSCFPSETVARPDFAERAEHYYERLDRTAAEDVGIVGEQQRGLTSPLATPGPVCHFEKICHHHRIWIADRVVGN